MRYSDFSSQTQPPRPLVPVPSIETSIELNLPAGQAGHTSTPHSPPSTPPPAFVESQKQQQLKRDPTEPEQQDPTLLSTTRWFVLFYLFFFVRVVETRPHTRFAWYASENNTGQTDGPTDRRTDTTSFRDATAHLKKGKQGGYEKEGGWK